MFKDSHSSCEISQISFVSFPSTSIRSFTTSTSSVLLHPMAASPSSRKVDDFLSSLSQLSQDRLKEDQQRQRQLQRDIDELRARLNSSSPTKLMYSSSSGAVSGSKSGAREIPLLVFNRNAKFQSEAPPMPIRPRSDDETPPPMPVRPGSDEATPPPMPARPDSPPAPALPRRREFDIDLMRPVAKAAPPKPVKKIVEKVSSPIGQFGRVSGSNPVSNSNYKTKFGSSENKPDKQYSSFAEMEDKIKGTKPVEIPINELNTPASSNQKAPIKPAKSDWLSSTLLKPNVSSGTYVPKPSYFSAISAAQAAKSLGANTSTILMNTHTPSTTTLATSPNRATSSPDRPTSWLDSAVKKTLSHESYTEPNQRNFTIDTDEDKKMTWLDSVAKKGPKHEYVEKRPSYQIPKKPASLSTKRYENEDPKKFVSPDVESAKVLAVVKKIPPPKPSKLDKKKEDHDELLRSQLGRLSPTKSFGSTAKKDFAAKDTELLKQQLSKLGSKGNSYAKTSTNYKEQDTELLRSQLSKLGSKTVKLPPQKEKDKAEGLLALSKLKPVKAPPQKVPEKPEALRRLDNLKGVKETDSKAGKKAPPKPETLKKLNRVETQQDTITELPSSSQNGSLSDLSKATPPASFEDRLSSILKSSTAPTLGASPMAPVSRSITDPGLSKRRDTSGGKLMHPNKSRAKGPRRKLPKSMARTKQAEAAPVGLSVEKRDTPGLKSKSSRIPPPIKAKPSLDQMKPSRNFSGEVFI